MDRDAFEAELRAQGYNDIVDRHMPAGVVNPEHAHEFDARVLILEGEMTIAAAGEERTYHTGSQCAIAAGHRHAERAGPEGVRYLAGRRFRATAG